MAQNYGELPCVNLGGIIHITTRATKCLCGAVWHYGSLNHNGKKFSNIIWRSLGAVNCEACKSRHWEPASIEEGGENRDEHG